MNLAREPICIAFCISNSFAQHAAVVIASALANSPGEKLEFHLLCGDLSEENHALLTRMANARCALFFYTVDRSAFDHYPVALEYFSQEIYYRYLIPELIPRKRILYSDVDVLMLRPLRPLWETALNGNALGAVKEYNEYRKATSAEAIKWKRYKRAIGMDENTPYFYSGLLLMDCDRLRAEAFTQRCFEDTETCIRTLDKETFGASDQVVINRLYEGRLTEIPPTWCVTHDMKRTYKGPVSIRHFAGQYEKPWCNVAWNTGWFAYLHYLLRTPYRHNALRFLLGHLKGIVFSCHTKKGYTRAFLFGIRLWKRRLPDQP